jgi:hypothetical protein
MDEEQDIDKPLSWEQIMHLMMRWHVHAIHIEFPTDRDGIYLYFMEITDQWQRWYIPANHLLYKEHS